MGLRGFHSKSFKVGRGGVGFIKTTHGVIFRFF